MSNGQDDNAGKPPSPPGVPQIAPARPMPRVTAPPVAPVAVSRPAPATAPQARPPGLPTISAPPVMPVVRAPGPGENTPTPAGAPTRTGPAGNTPLPVGALVRPVAVGNQNTPLPATAPSAARPFAPIVTRPGTSTRPALPRPPTPVLGPAAAGPVMRPPGPVIAAPVLPPLAAPVARPASAPPGALVSPAPAATRPPSSAPSGILVPPAPAARPPSAPPGALVPPAPAAQRPATGPVAAIPSGARPSPLPPSGAIERITAQQSAALRTLATGLATLDYFETLGLSQAASSGEIKKAFYRESRIYHPDRFFHLPESEVRSDIGSIYKRITEAYYFLKDDAKRKKYLADITGAERAKKLRYTESTESELKAESRKTAEEEFGTNPKSRPFFKTGMAEFEKGNWVAAERSLKMGLTYEPGNERFKEKLAEAKKKIEDERRALGPSYMIK